MNTTSAAAQPSQLVLLPRADYLPGPFELGAPSFSRFLRKAWDFTLKEQLQ